MPAFENMYHKVDMEAGKVEAKIEGGAETVTNTIDGAAGFIDTQAGEVQSKLDGASKKIEEKATDLCKRTVDGVNQWLAEDTGACSKAVNGALMTYAEATDFAQNVSRRMDGLTQTITTKAGAVTQSLDGLQQKMSMMAGAGFGIGIGAASLQFNIGSCVDFAKLISKIQEIIDAINLISQGLEACKTIIPPIEEYIPAEINFEVSCDEPII